MEKLWKNYEKLVTELSECCNCKGNFLALIYHNSNKSSGNLLWGGGKGTGPRTGPATCLPATAAINRKIIIPEFVQII